MRIGVPAMKGHPQVIEMLNEVLMGELTAINQYFLHSKMCKNWGYEKIAAIIHKESIDEMKHAAELTDRILLLEGLPNLQKLGKLHIGETVLEQLESDEKMEVEAIERIRKGIDLCLEKRDHVSRELLEHILVDEEKHLDWIQSQLGIIKDISLPNYLAQHIHP
jgi:bacterioferritin